LYKVNQRRSREYEKLETRSDVIEVLQTQFQNKRLHVRYSVEKTEVVINDLFYDKTLMVVTDPSINKNETLSVFGLSDKYLELDLEILEERGPGYFHCKILTARRATKGRRDLRFKVTPEEVVATNFKISKHTIDVTNFNIPTSIKVVLDQFQSSNSSLSDYLKVDVFNRETTDPILQQIKKSGKTLFIADVDDLESYKPITDDFFDFEEFSGTKLNSYLKSYNEKGYKSIIIVPIIYLGEVDSSTPFAYIHLISKTENFNIDKVLELKDLSFKLVDRIRDANTHLVSVHQDIIDISRGGAKIKITDENLKGSFLKARGFICDIVFKLQAPITIYGEIKCTYFDESNNLLVGVDFEGNSSRKDEMKRFYAILKPMEAEYKAQLIRRLKKGK
jgi:hypothetical protein